MTFLDRFRHLAIEHDLNRIYRRRFAAFGHTPKGVFWNSTSNQMNRYASLLKLIGSSDFGPRQSLEIAEIGCGYGALFDYLKRHAANYDWRYQGIDINPSMIKACKARFPDDAHRFYVGKKPANSVDFCLFSGTYNLCTLDDWQVWERYIFTCLDACWNKSRLGMAINFLCAAAPKIRKQIYYANRDAFLDTACSRFGPTRCIPTRNVDGDFSFLITRKQPQA